jgi:8-oxo-dGTP pyrophosphatase MutT (NUDIX family)
MLSILEDKTALIDHIVRVLHERTDAAKVFTDDAVNRRTSASVLLLLGLERGQRNRSAKPCLILNKRSSRVRQPGDLCFPGGSITPRLDASLAKIFSLPLTSLGRWRYWSHWKRVCPQPARLLALLWATALRESMEEMRLNPFGAKFLGPLPPQNLVMFQRKIYPMAAWVQHQQRFFPNWEVEKILYVPLQELLDSANYRCYRLNMKIPADVEPSDLTRDYPCFQFQNNSGTEILWGATFRITALFLEYIFHFHPPALETLPIIEGRLNQNYHTGQR